MAPANKESVPFGVLLAKAKAIAKEDEAIANEEEEKLMKVKKEKEAEDKVGKKEAKAKAKATAKAKAKAKADKVKVKKELKVKLGKTQSSILKRKRKEEAKSAKAKAKGKKVKVKMEPGKEKEEGRAKSGLDWCKRFYKNQSGFIDQVIAAEWKVCFGALGSGLVGVRFQAGEPEDAGAASEKMKGRDLRKDDVLVLFINAPSCAPQMRGGKTLAGYGSGFDVENKTLAWSSQRSDLQNKLINQIIDHIGVGGRILVAVRPPFHSADGDYRLLGHVTKVDGVQLAQCLVNAGESMICDISSGVLHKAITTACLPDSARRGEGHLGVRRWNDDQPLCKCCCYRTPSLVLHFDYLEPAGVEAYICSAKGKKKKELKTEPSTPTLRPKKRFRVKKPLEEERGEAAAPDPAPLEVAEVAEGEPEEKEAKLGELSTWPQFVSIKAEPPDL